MARALPVSPGPRARTRRGVLARLLSSLLVPAAAITHAGPFVVHPTRLELGSAYPSGALTVRNEGPAALTFQIQALRWTQDDAGQEHYTDTQDLIYLPRLLTLPPGQSGVIRLGLRGPAGPLEKTYRLFIEELAPPRGAEGAPASRIRVLVRFGAPVFVAPLAPQQRLAQGQAHWTLRNEGSRHEVFQSIVLRGLQASGAEIFREEITGRYLLAGAVRHFRSALPQHACPHISRLVLEVKTEHSQLSREHEPNAFACEPRATTAQTPG